MYTYTQWQRRSQTLARRVCVRWCGNVQNHQMRSLAVSGEGHSRSVAANECVCHARAPRHRFAVMNGQPRKRTQTHATTYTHGTQRASACAPHARRRSAFARGIWHSAIILLAGSGSFSEWVRMRACPHVGERGDLSGAVSWVYACCTRRRNARPLSEVPCLGDEIVGIYTPTH